ncbi:hypothetical protein CLV59_105150 [Chitinophaga dinghuensis]|uniref:Uncharacterized protein n=1 Tax=Chitinophaga dinghuensis TaxID=1539050 RepID=A0A327VXI2_9BACT|nr:hypothetical protein [Chitinophaga dinghuensis]RAJ80043.1 hypothetical protein CLV59_105150 [Chitinophaga dinghuensis]
MNTHWKYIATATAFQELYGHFYANEAEMKAGYAKYVLQRNQEVRMAEHWQIASPQHLQKTGVRFYHNYFNIRPEIPGQIYWLIRPDKDPASWGSLVPNANGYTLQTGWCRLIDNKFTVSLPKTAGDHCCQAFATVINNAIAPIPGPAKMEGTKYDLGSCLDGEIRLVTKRAPEADSQPGKIVRMITLLMDYSASGNSDILQTVITL